MIRKYLIGALILIGSNCLSQQQKTYTNPVGDTVRIADPFVLQYDGQYYLYGTSAVDGFKAWKSSDLVNWDTIGYVFKRDSNSWGQGSFWAPEVIYRNNKFYLVYSCRGKAMFGEGLRICLSVSNSPEGPFEELYSPLFDFGYGAIDAHLFIDNGKPFLYYEMVGAVGNIGTGGGFLWGIIMGMELSDNLAQPVSEPKLCIYPSQEWEGINSMLARSNEGMTVFKIDSTYYMTYSGNHFRDPNYGVGYATSDKPLGGLWTKFDKNPILQNDLENKVSGPGHSSIAKSPDGKETFIIYHSHENPDAPSGRRILNIDRLIVSQDGTLSVAGPSRNPQSMPSGVK